MGQVRSLRLLLLIALVGSGGDRSWGGDSAAEKALNEKGLLRTGHTFVIEDEKPVLEKLKDVRGVFASFATIAEKRAEAEQMTMQSAMLDQDRAELQANLNMLNQEISATGAAAPIRMGRRSIQQTANNNPLLAQKAQMTTTLAQIGQTQQALRSRALPSKDKAALDADVKKKADDFKTALEDFRKEVDKVTKKYDELGADSTVKKAIDDLWNASKAKVNLGPSDAFHAMMKELDQAEHRFLGKKTSATSKHKAAAKAKK